MKKRFADSLPVLVRDGSPIPSSRGASLDDRTHTRGIIGDIEPDDADTFQRKTYSLTEGMVFLKSYDGSIIAGIRIGEMIRDKGYPSWKSKKAPPVRAGQV